MPAPVELGAEFVHGRPEATWSLIREFGLLVHDVPFDFLQRRKGKLVRLDDFSHELERVMAGLSRLKRDESFTDYLRFHARLPWMREARKMAIAFVQGFDAADPDVISAKSLAEEQEGLGDVGEEMQFRLAGGYGALIDALARSLPARRVRIRLNTAVKRVEWKRGRVEVHAAAKGRRGGARRTEVFRARRAVVTLPLGVLQLAPGERGHVVFDPDIPVTRAAWDRLESGPVVKVLLRFREAFWETSRPRRRKQGSGEPPRADLLRDLSFVTDPEAEFPTFWTQRPLRVPLITAWAGGPKAAALSGLSRDEIVRAALRSLAPIVGRSVTGLKSMLERAWVADWLADPWSRGAYSYVKVNGGGAHAVLSKPVEETLYFAGEACDDSGQASTVAGALASGARAARLIARNA